jgi:hypothetical protein
MASESGTDFPKLYENIKNARLATMTVRHLDGGAVQALTDLGSFKDNDSRSGGGVANYIHNYSHRQNISTSFKLSNFL